MSLYSESFLIILFFRLVCTSQQVVGFYFESVSVNIPTVATRKKYKLPLSESYISVLCVVLLTR
jgi:hypothetical protein